MRKNRYDSVFLCTVVIMLNFLNCQTLSSFIISDEDEIEIGNKFKAQIIADKEQYPLYSDRADYAPQVIRYIDSLGGLLADVQGDRPLLNFTFTVIDDTLVNAFAIPGGHIFIYKGLLQKAENGAEVAGVLAHEIGHITKYHGKKMLASQGIVGSINSILFGDSSTIESTVTMLLENMAFLKYSRSNEYQADSCSVAYTTKAGINPRGMYSFLQKLDSKSITFEPFSTHPDTKSRLENVDDVINKTPNVPSAGEKVFVNEYLEIRALLK